MLILTDYFSMFLGCGKVGDPSISDVKPGAWFHRCRELFGTLRFRPVFRVGSVWILPGNGVPASELFTRKDQERRDNPGVLEAATNGTAMALH
jgi:hypothetical protein